MKKRSRPNAEQEDLLQNKIFKLNNLSWKWLSANRKQETSVSSDEGECSSSSPSGLNKTFTISSSARSSKPSEASVDSNRTVTFSASAKSLDKLHARVSSPIMFRNDVPYTVDVCTPMETEEVDQSPPTYEQWTDDLRRNRTDVIMGITNIPEALSGTFSISEFPSNSTPENSVLNATFTIAEESSINLNETLCNRKC